MMKTSTSKNFDKQFSKLPAQIQDLTVEKVTVFKQNPFDSRLKIHKLKGKMEGLWSFSVNYQYRVVFRKTVDETIYFLSIGTHEIYI